MLFPAVLVGSLYLLFAGHNQPGGGFVGGLVAGAAIALRYVAGGIDEVRALSRAAAVDDPRRRPAARRGRPRSCRCSLGDPVLDVASAATLDLPAARARSSCRRRCVFDIGVYLVVVGLVLMVFEAFGDDPPTEPTSRRERRRTVSVLLALAAAALFGIGTYLVLQRKLSRIIIGLGLLSHGANVLLDRRRVAAASPPLIGAGDAADFADPLPQALALTAIVITFGVTALPARAGLPQLAADPRRRGGGRRRRPRRGSAAAARPGGRRRDGRRATERPTSATSDARRADDRVNAPRRAARSCCRCSAPRCAILLGRSRRRRSGPSALVVAHRRRRRSSIVLLVEVDRDGTAGRSRPAAGRRRSASRSSPTGCRRSCSPSAALMLLAVLVYAIGQPGAERNHVGFQSVYLILAAGVAGVVPHRRPVQPVRRVRDDADRELRAAHPRRPAASRCAPA